MRTRPWYPPAYVLVLLVAANFALAQQSNDKPGKQPPCCCERAQAEKAEVCPIAALFGLTVGCAERCDECSAQKADAKRTQAACTPPATIFVPITLPFLGPLFEVAGMPSQPYPAPVPCPAAPACTLSGTSDSCQRTFVVAMKIFEWESSTFAKTIAAPTLMMLEGQIGVVNVAHGLSVSVKVRGEGKDNAQVGLEIADHPRTQPGIHLQHVETRVELGNTFQLALKPDKGEAVYWVQATVTEATPIRPQVAAKHEGRRVYSEPLPPPVRRSAFGQLIPPIPIPPMPMIEPAVVRLPVPPPPAPTGWTPLLQCSAVEPAKPMARAWSVRAADSDEGCRLEVESGSEAKLTCTSLCLQLSSGCLKVCAGEQLKVCGPGYEGRADRLSKNPGDDGVVLEGSVYLWYHCQGQRAEVRADRVVVRAKDGQLEIQARTSAE